MRFYKIIFMGFIVTVTAIGYVHQRVEIVKTGYIIQKNRKYLSCLVDRNTNLMYNLSKLESPRYLLASLKGEEIKFASHRTRQANIFQVAHAGPGSGARSESLVDRFLDLVTVSAEAKPRELSTN